MVSGSPGTCARSHPVSCLARPSWIFAFQTTSLIRILRCCSDLAPAVAILRSEQFRTVFACDCDYIWIEHVEFVTARKTDLQFLRAAPIRVRAHDFYLRQVKNVIQPEKNTLETILVVEDDVVVLRVVSG